MPRSLVWATDVDVLPIDRVVERKAGFLLVRSPGNPMHHWRARIADLRVLLRDGRGAWVVAVDPGSGEVVASWGVVVTGGRGRFQVVETAASHRRRGICSRLVVEAARRARDAYGAERFVIAADADYHAAGLYESLGFEPAERVFGVCRWPRTGS